MLGHSLEIGCIHFPDLAVLDVLDAADEVFAMQLKVHWGAIFHGDCNVTLSVRLYQVGPTCYERMEAAGHRGDSEVAFARHVASLSDDSSFQVSYQKRRDDVGVTDF